MIKFFDELSSTQEHLINLINNGLDIDYMIVAKRQTSGVGSRGNRWISDDGGLYFSFCIDESKLSDDIEICSLSIYFAYLMKDILESLGSSVWIKWPNDFYIKDKKIGGIITTKIKNKIICGIGINLSNAPEIGDNLDIKVDIKNLLNSYSKIIYQKISWKQIFSKFLLEFNKSKEFKSHINNKEISLKDAILCEDGSIFINGKKVYSLR